jgi:hypothetical protein
MIYGKLPSAAEKGFRRSSWEWGKQQYRARRAPQWNLTHRKMRAEWGIAPNMSIDTQLLSCLV